MIQLKPFKSKAFLKESIAVAFKGDTELHQYHISPSDNIDDMVNHTYHTIIDTAKEMKINYYAVVINGEVIGFTCIAPAYNWVYSFGINPEYRNKTVLLSWLNKVERIIAGDVYIYLYTKNTRAVDFFKKNNYTTAYDFLVFEANEPIAVLVKNQIPKIEHVHDLDFEHGLG